LAENEKTPEYRPANQQQARIDHAERDDSDYDRFAKLPKSYNPLIDA
jgi:hypothetical protein